MTARGGYALALSKNINVRSMLKPFLLVCRGRCLHRPGRTGRFYGGLRQIRSCYSGTMWASSPTSVLYARVRVHSGPAMVPIQQKKPKRPGAAIPFGDICSGRFGSGKRQAHGRTAHPSSNGCYIRYPDSQLRNGNLAAHRVDCLVLLGSPPDTVHRALLRKTKSSTPLIWVRRHNTHPPSGIPPRCSGLRVTRHRYLPE